MCAEEDCSGAKGEMGDGEGGKEDGLVFIGRIIDANPRAKVLDGFWGPMEQIRAASAKKSDWAWRPFMLPLLPKVIDLYRRIRPSNSAFCYLESLLCGEKFFESEDHHTLGE
jgi:hypothetical protein